ncbi:hypothetical protein [Parabacteroides sp. PF5-9]|uniref:hypothetical protein n=1 Tax=Parabacteroides sp. PF5-9 TaxID=1742404 RepID=UPI002473CFAA|nr:hypothetical protein [Parabacteroides sp. PF5-9]MDH6357797.1 hypothetical protein [Parabacteroides sp. PF5-9]
MSQRRSTYVFPSESDYNDAKDHIYRQMYGDYSDSNKIYFYGSWGSCSQFDWDTCYRIDIYSDCSDAVQAADIFREHRGRFYDM